ncbi:MAG: polysaccharide biosynthesis tyrosine autokinase [Deltaproteobacteria bacterium]|nr:polysaccharide biosynthesis tyrosine autokinase [Deltaproteobacteria bacterium]
MEIMDKQINLQDYLRVILKHRWTILAVFAVVFVSVTLFTFTATPIYRATARLIIEKDDPKVVSIQEVMSVDSSGLDYYQTQYKIIESRSVAREVIRRLKLNENEEFVPKPKDTFLDNLRQSIADGVTFVESLLKTEKPQRPTDPKAESEDESPLVTAFIRRVKVAPIRNSRLVDIGFEAKDPALSSKIANTLARSYIDLNLETKLKATQDAMAWLNSRIQDERKKVDQAEQALLRYKERHNIITDFSKDVETVTAQKLAALNSQVIEAEVKRVEAETRYRQAIELERTPEMLDSIPEVLNNELVRQIKTMEVELQKKQSELSKKYGANHPQIVAIRNEQETLKTRKAEEVNRVINSLYNGFKVAQAREQSLKASLNRQKGESFTLNEKAIDYSVLKREAESTKEMYDLVIKRFKETSMTENIRTGNIRVVDAAEIPKFPVSPKKTQNMLLGLIVGLALGIGLAFFLEYLDNTIKTPDDIKERLKIPYLGPVPVLAMAAPDNPGGKPGNPGTREQKPEEDLIIISSPKSTASESYRGLRTSILFSAADAPPRTILVTSAAPAEGKTITSANIAVAMAQAGNKILLIDCDLRRPRMHRVFNVPRDRGLSNILAGTCGIDEAILLTTIPGVDIIPSGPVPPNPSEMLGSQSMFKIIEALRGRYDRIIIDSPPITAVTDSVIISRWVDGVLLVIRAGETHREIIKNGIGLLQSANAHILGAILNGVDMGRDSYYYYQYYYYYYGEDGEKRKKVHRKKRAQSRYSGSDHGEPEGVKPDTAA